MNSNCKLTTVLEATVSSLCLDSSGLRHGLLADEWTCRCLVWDFLTVQGATEIEISPWEERSSGAAIKIRRVTLRMPLPPTPMCPPATRATVVYRIDASMEDSIQITSSAVSHDIPFGECFSIEEQITLIASGSGVLVKKAFGCHFSKTVKLRQKIEQGIAAAQRRSSSKLLSVLQDYASCKSDKQLDSDGLAGHKLLDSNIYTCSSSESTDVASDGSADEVSEAASFTPGNALEELFNSALESQRTRLRLHLAHIQQQQELTENITTDDDTMVLELWEVQQRSRGSLRKDFQRVRWVDPKSGRQHPLITKPERDAAVCETPPVQPPVGWRDASGGWCVADPNWQYAADLNEDDEKWCAAAEAASSCSTKVSWRRRKWRCELLRAPANAQPRRRLVEVWELQRRLSMFSNTWYAPFLLHDKQKRWRWLDTDFKPHPLTRASCIREAAATEDVPPLEVPPSWRQSTAWFIVEPRVNQATEVTQATQGTLATNQDAETYGWEYAIDFRRSEKFWSASNRAAARHLCRRRLWRCYYEEELAHASIAPYKKELESVSA